MHIKDQIYWEELAKGLELKLLQCNGRESAVYKCGDSLRILKVGRDLANILEEHQRLRAELREARKQNKAILSESQQIIEDLSRLAIRKTPQTCVNLVFVTPDAARSLM